MAQLIKAHDVKVVTKDGECKLSISIDLNLNLNTSGITVGVQNVKTEQVSQQEKEKNTDGTQWEIPDFTPMPKLNFGKKA